MAAFNGATQLGTPSLVATDKDVPVSSGNYYWLSRNRLLVERPDRGSRGARTAWYVFYCMTGKLVRSQQLTEALQDVPCEPVQFPESYSACGVGRALSISPSGTHILFHDAMYSRWSIIDVNGVTSRSWSGIGWDAIGFWSPNGADLWMIPHCGFRRSVTANSVQSDPQKPGTYIDYSDPNHAYPVLRHTATPEQERYVVDDYPLHKTMMNGIQYSAELGVSRTGSLLVPGVEVYGFSGSLTNSMYEVDPVRDVVVQTWHYPFVAHASQHWISDIAISHNGKMVAAIVNENTKRTLYVAPFGSQRYAKVAEVPPTTGSYNLQWIPGDRYLSFKADYQLFAVLVDGFH
jgi:hypothetical protein